MQPRIDNPALALPGAIQALQGLSAAIAQAGIPETTLYLVELRASQINGCAVCVDSHGFIPAIGVPARDRMPGPRLSLSRFLRLS